LYLVSDALDIDIYLIYFFFGCCVAARLSGNALVLINVVALRRARLVLGWVTVRGYTILVFNQDTPVYSAWPSLVGRHNEYWRWSRPPLGKKRRVLRNSRPWPLCHHLHTKHALLHSSTASLMVCLRQTLLVIVLLLVCICCLELA